MRFALGLEYDGRFFHGWQKQATEETVQRVVEAALAQIAGEAIPVVCAGRTDTGVHATEQVIHFDTEVKRPLEAWVRGVNTFLPPSVAVLWAKRVDDDFHARFSARGRHYRYLLINRPQRLGLWHGRAGWTHHPLDLTLMQEAANQLLGEHDFSAFRAADCQAKSPIKRLWRADLVQTGELIFIDFEASAFLHHMVRNLVGSLVYVGQGLKPPEWMGDLLQEKNRKLAAPTFSAAGLYLVRIFYETHVALPQTEDSLLPGAFRDDEKLRGKRQLSALGADS